MVMIHYRVMSGTGSLRCQIQGSLCRDLAGGVSGTNRPGGLAIETRLASVGHRDGRRRRSVAGRWRALEAVERIGGAVSRKPRRMGMEGGSETRALGLCLPTVQSALTEPSQRSNRRFLQRLR